MAGLGDYEKKAEGNRGYKMRSNPFQRNYGIGSPIKLTPSYVNDELVSDNAADLAEERNRMIDLGKIKGEKTKVERKGESAKIKILKDIRKKGGPNAKPDPIDNMMLEEADEYSRNPENRDEITKAWYLNNPGYKLVDGKKVKA